MSINIRCDIQVLKEYVTSCDTQNTGLLRGSDGVLRKIIISDVCTPTTTLCGIIQEIVSNPGISKLTREEFNQLVGLVSKFPCEENILKEIVIKGIASEALVFGFPPIEGRFLKDKEVVFAAVKHYLPEFQYASDELKNDKEFILRLIEQFGSSIFEYASESLKNDREFILTLVQRHGAILRHTSLELKNDKVLVLAAVKQYGKALYYASNDLKNNKEVVIAAVLQSGEALRYASNELRNDIDVVLSAIFQDGKALECASDVLKNNKEVVLAAIGQNLSALQFAGSKIRQNIIIQLAITIYDNQPVDIENLSIRKILKAWYSHLNYHLNFPVFIKIIEIFNHSTLQNFEKKQLLKSMFDLMGSLKDEVIQSDSASRIIHAIFTLANLSGRRALIKEFNQLSVNELNAISAQPSKEITNRTQFELRIKVLLARLNSVSGNSIFSLDIAETLYLNFLKDTKMQLVLFSYLEIVINSYSKLPQSQKDTLIGWLKNNLNKPLQPHMIKKFKLLTSIEAIFGSGAMIEVNNKSLEEIEAYFAKAFNKLFQGASIIQDADLSSQLFFRYQETFAQFREPMAIFAYLQSVKQVEPIVYKALTEYVYHVLKGDFDQFRNKHIEDQPHLANLYQKPDIKELWLAHPQSLELTDSGITEAIDIIHFFHQKVVVDNHFQDEDASKPSVLKEYLKQAAKNATIDHQPYLRMLEENKAQLALHTSSDTILLVRNRLELLIIKFCSKEVDLDTFKKEREALYTNRLVRKNEVEKVLSNDFELLYQQSLLDMPGGKHNVQFTTDPNDLFLLGTEVQGSCQNIYGTPNLNKCLLGYMINGESQAIVIKDRLNRIVGRGVVRLLSDDKGDPVLFLERLYLNKQLDSWKEAIISMAKEKAKTMKLPLLSKEVGKGEPVEGAFYFRGGRAPFIYSDASGGVLNGQEGFKITGAHILLKPQ